jgi:hypothetical protein
MIQTRMPPSKPQAGERVVALRDWRCLEPMDEPSPKSTLRKRGLLRKAAKLQPLRLLLSPPMIVILSAIFAALVLTAFFMWVSVVGFALAGLLIFHVVRKYLWPRIKSAFGGGADKAIA